MLGHNLGPLLITHNHGHIFRQKEALHFQTHFLKLSANIKMLSMGRSGKPSNHLLGKFPPTILKDSRSALHPGKMARFFQS